MAKRRPKPGKKIPKRIAPEERLAHALEKQTKAELIEVLVELAGDDRGILYLVRTMPSDLLSPDGYEVGV